MIQLFETASSYWFIDDEEMLLYRCGKDATDPLYVQYRDKVQPIKSYQILHYDGSDDYTDTYLYVDLMFSEWMKSGIFVAPPVSFKKGSL